MQFLRLKSISSEFCHLSDAVSAVLLIKDISVVKNWSNRVSYSLNYYSNLLFFKKEANIRVSVLGRDLKKNMWMLIVLKSRALSF